MFFDGPHPGEYSRSSECLEELKNRFQRKALTTTEPLQRGHKQICRISMTECGVLGCKFAIDHATFSVYRGHNDRFSNTILVQHNGEPCDKLNPDSTSSVSSA